MARRTLCLLLAAAMALSLCGCWNYRGLDELSIVTGMAIDKDPQSGLYHLTFEATDLSKPTRNEGPKPLIVESHGVTIFEAVRAAKRRTINKLYFGHMEMAVLSQHLVENEDLSGIINWFLSDAECRESITLVISKEKTAGEILTGKSLGHSLVSLEMIKIIESDNSVSASTVFIELFQLYGLLEGKGKALTLPSFHKVQNNGEEVVELQGMAVFKGERFCGYLTPEEAKSFLFVNNDIKGGVFTFSSMADEYDDISLEILDNKTEKSFIYKDGRIRIKIKTDTLAFLNENHRSIKGITSDSIKKLEKIAEARLAADIATTIRKVQSEYGSDIFGFGQLVYKKNPRLWEQVGPIWEDYYKGLDVEIECKINISDTAFSKS